MSEGCWVEIFAFYCAVVLHFLQRHSDSWISASVVPLARGMDSQNLLGLEQLQKVGAVIWEPGSPYVRGPGINVGHVAGRHSGSWSRCTWFPQGLWGGGLHTLGTFPLVPEQTREGHVRLRKEKMNIVFCFVFFRNSRITYKITSCWFLIGDILREHWKTSSAHITEELLTLEPKTEILYNII